MVYLIHIVLSVGGSVMRAKGLKFSFILLVFFVLFSNVSLFAAGKQDSNGLKSSDYDKNGWAYKDGKWIPSPDGATYRVNNNENIQEQGSITIEDVVYEEITDIENIEIALEENIGELDINGLNPSDYDINGWAQKDGKWVASPDGALYKGGDKFTFSIATVINKMTDEEKGMLKAILLYGNDLEKKAGNIINSPTTLREYGKNLTSQWVASQLDEAFTKGTGFVDSLRGSYRNYGRQLDFTIKDILVKNFKVKKPMFTRDAGSIGGAIQRENWITENMLDILISNMTEEERIEFAKAIVDELKSKGNDIGDDVVIAFTYGGLVTTRKVLGFKFYMFITTMTKKVVMFLTGKTLPFVVYTTLTQVVKRVFDTAVPIISVIMAVKLVVIDLPGFINPRDYDKFIPAVLLIGMCRISQEGS
jgi:hypothetical protein